MKTPLRSLCVAAAVLAIASTTAAQQIVRLFFYAPLISTLAADKSVVAKASFIKE